MAAWPDGSEIRGSRRHGPARLSGSRPWPTAKSSDSRHGGGDDLVSLFVDPAHHGRGIGRALFDACENDAAENGHGLRRLTATLNAVSYYEARGFRQLRESYRVNQGQRIPHIEMTRDLP